MSLQQTNIAYIIKYPYIIILYKYPYIIILFIIYYPYIVIPKNRFSIPSLIIDFF